jgi:four helix bundle protein
MNLHNFRNIIAWQKSRELVKLIYPYTVTLTENRHNDLSRQILRSAISIPSNIAEGSGRGTIKDFMRFLRIALGSATELETQLILSVDLNLIDEAKGNILLKKVNEVEMIICGFINKLEKQN